MICQLLRKTAFIAALTAALTACTQGGVSSDPALGEGGGNAKAHNAGYSHAGRFGGSGAVAGIKSLSGSLMRPPPDYNQLTGTGGNLWDRLRTNFQLINAENKPQVQAQINWFMHNQAYLDKTLKRAAPYMYLIFQETQSRNLPAELVLLPIMESAYNPFIRSSRGAVGLWQLMSTTANGFGVKQDFWYDGRRDVYASTNAALDYLTYLQSYFGGDWLLAIAAYDAGEGRLQGAVRRNAERGLSTDFWSLSLPAETQAYVPRLLALAAIISNPGKYHVSLPPVTDQPYLQQVDLGAPINLSEAAKMADMSLVELKALNPGYSRTTTGPNGPYRLLLPIDRIAVFKERLAALPALTGTSSWGRYKVQHGDTLNSVADRFATTVAELREVNHLRGNALPVGHVIMIPAGHTQLAAQSQTDDLNTDKSLDQKALTADNVVAKAADEAADQAPVMSASAADETEALEKTYHVVKRGDTLSTIARRYGVKISDIQQWNKLKAGAALKPGVRLIVARAAGKASEAKEERSLAKIHNKSNKITMAAGSAEKAAGKPQVDKRAGTAKTLHYTVRSGDNLVRIASRHSVKVADLRKWNHLAENALVKPGQELVIYK